MRIHIFLAVEKSCSIALTLQYFWFIFWRPFVKLFALFYQTIVSAVCLSVCNVSSLIFVLKRDVKLRPTNPSLTLVYCDQTAGWIKMKLGVEVGLGLGHIELGTQLPQKGHSPPIHVCCVQTAGWIKMPLGMEVDLGPEHIVLDGDPAPLQKGHCSPPLFDLYLLWPNGCPSQLLLSTYQVTQSIMWSLVTSEPAV